MNRPPPCVHFIHPGDLQTLTGGYRYARELLAALAARGRAPQVHRLADSFPSPAAQDLAAADARLSRIADGAIVVIDGLACGAMPTVVARHARRLKLVCLLHHPLALETGLSATDADRLRQDEREALRAMRAVIVTSAATASELIQHYGVASDRITVILPGTARQDAGRGQAGRGPARVIELLCVATLTPRKGQAELVQALAGPRLGGGTAAGPRGSWRLTCIGAADRDPAYAAALRASIRKSGLDDRVVLAGPLDDAAVAHAYRDADVFVLASHHEGYGMVLAEAVAHHLPIVSTTAGAVAQTVPAGVGLLVPPADVDALRAALARVIDDHALRETMAAAAEAAAAQLPNWLDAAERFCGLVDALADPYSPGRQQQDTDR